MRAHIEFVFRPTNFLIRWIASAIGAPTMGIIRAGETMEEFGDDYEASAVVVAPDHRIAEIKALASPLRHSMYRAAKFALAQAGLKIGWVHKHGGRFVRVDPR